jgi:hypothetical protein
MNIAAIGIKTIIVVGLIATLGVARASLADEQLPFVRLREVAGHLRLETCLPPGRGTFEADDPAGLKLSGFVYVTGEGEAKRPRIFRLRGTLAGEADNRARGDDSPKQFLIRLRTTPNPDHYELQVEVEQFAGGPEHATLGRNCCGYYVSASRQAPKLPIGRGALLTDLMLAEPETYRAFEHLAEICCRPGFEFVPSSSLSPSLVEEVIAADEAAPTAEAADAFRHLLDELDSEGFADREAATARLIRGGRTTLWSLNHLVEQALSAEQRHRVKGVRQALSQYSDPALPFAFDRAALRQLEETPPAAWLSTLCNSSDVRVSRWARERTERAKAAASSCLPKIDP